MANSVKVTDVLSRMPLYERVRRCREAAAALEPAVAAARLPVDFTQPGRIDAAEDGTVTLFADNSAQSAKLRQVQPRLARALAEAGIQCPAVRVKVRPVSPVCLDGPQPEKTERNRPLSAESGEAIRRVAESCRDEKIREALMRLADSVSGN